MYIYSHTHIHNAQHTYTNIYKHTHTQRQRDRQTERERHLAQQSFTKKSDHHRQTGPVGLRAKIQLFIAQHKQNVKTSARNIIKTCRQGKARQDKAYVLMCSRQHSIE